MYLIIYLNKYIWKIIKNYIYTVYCDKNEIKYVY